MYSFTCPLPGCGEVLKSAMPTKEQAISDLVTKAHHHLMQKHPDVRKTHEEVVTDISSGIIKQ